MAENVNNVKSSSEKSEKNRVNKTREGLTQMYLESLKQGTIPWRKGWHSYYGSASFNGVTNRRYMGINRAWLAMFADFYHYNDPRWCTFNQAKAKGWHVKAGSKLAPVELWKLYDREQKKYIDLKEADQIIKDDPDRKKDMIWTWRNFYVVNYSCLEGPEPLQEYEGGFTEELMLDEFTQTALKAMDITVYGSADRAYYSPREDSISIPNKRQFESAYDYYATLLHEMTHATGNKKRLDRDQTGHFGTEDYAREELVAEIGSSFVMADLHFSGDFDTDKNHAAYIQSWIKVIENDPNELMRAVTLAGKASDYLLEKGDAEKLLQKNYGPVALEQVIEAEPKIVEPSQSKDGPELSL